MFASGTVRAEPYYVCRGDTLEALAADYASQIDTDRASTLAMFQAANTQLASGAPLEPGGYVQLPRLLSHARLVERDQGLWGIAERELRRHYGLPRSRLEQALVAAGMTLARLVAKVCWQLASHNGIADPACVYEGEVVAVPALELPILRADTLQGCAADLPSIIVDPALAQTSVSEPVFVADFSIPQPPRPAVGRTSPTAKPVASQATSSGELSSSGMDGSGLEVVQGELVMTGELAISVNEALVSYAEASDSQTISVGEVRSPDGARGGPSIAEMISEMFEREEDIPTSPYFLVGSFGASDGARTGERTLPVARRGVRGPQGAPARPRR